MLELDAASPAGGRAPSAPILLSKEASGEILLKNNNPLELNKKVISAATSPTYKRDNIHDHNLLEKHLFSTGGERLFTYVCGLALSCHLLLK
ncbi:hypothetical protein ACQCVP_14275 [Rossellomorea vietnamensis]|uniref:hypothetical protein n=1 Tax=Rossellomorea vietnamensis TaxID=218284 RepID=UPI003CF57DE7